MLEEQKVDWLTAMEVKIKLDQAEAKANDAGERAVLLWQQLCERDMCPAERGAAVLSYGLGGRSTGEDVELEPAR